MRRRLMNGLQGLGDQLQQMGMQGLMQKMGGQPSMPMTGSGVKDGNVPQTPNAPDRGDAATMGAHGDPMGSDGDGPDSEGQGDIDQYILPSRPSSLARDASPQSSSLMQLTRRRLDEMGRRRI